MFASLLSINILRGVKVTRPSTATHFLRVRFSSHMGESGEDIEKEKEKSLKGKANESIPDHPGWNEKLASHAEASVKADHASEKPLEQLQRESVQHIKKQHH
ncbi:hypothetical protein K7432_004555 [Basidiobolus ranarum]|uniref:Uncharacterized protein n=1 Tax=Basidiobolus ranarum TaxID=34480 RepID=A0ABR2WXY5_9FUNG